MRFVSYITIIHVVILVLAKISVPKQDTLFCFVSVYKPNYIFRFADILPAKLLNLLPLHSDAASNIFGNETAVNMQKRKKCSIPIT